MAAIKRFMWLASVGAALTVSQASVAQQAAVPLYRQASAPMPERVADLLGRMTLEEKIAQLQANSNLPPVPGMAINRTPAFRIVHDGKVDDAVARRSLGDGMGGFTILPFDLMQPGKTVAAGEVAAQADLIQRWVMTNTRLGIPILFQGEALHGAVVGGATSFPQAIALGSTWNPALIREMFGAVAKESRAAGFSMVLAPVFDLARDPRYGRVEEMYSEDPYLVGEIGVAAVQGLQGPGGAIDGAHVIATAKHFVHGQPESGTNKAPNDVSERTMRDIFLPPFEKAVRVAQIGAIMPSYNENSGGVPSHANSWLLKDVLRGEWGFTGITASDWFAVSELYTSHHVATSNADAGARAFNAGVDMELPNAAGFEGLLAAVKSGQVRQADIDAAVSRVLALKFRAGLFERPYTNAKQDRAALASPEHARLARRVADEAMILLRNEGGMLPLDPKAVKNMAVIGPNAAKARLGGYSGVPPYYVTVLEGVRKRLGPGATVTYAEGVRISEPDKDPLANKLEPYEAPSAENDARLTAEAVEVARKADVVLFVLGGNETVTREAFPGGMNRAASLGDTDDLNLPGRQDALVREIAKLGKPMAAVLLNGRAQSIVELSRTVPAIVEGWYLGQETGNAVAGVLFGDVNPSGKLTVTVPRGAGQVPVFYNRTPQARLGYVFNDNSPLYPFGHGLSYTSFAYGKPALDRATIAARGSAMLSVDVTNSGNRAGDEIVQVYIHPETSSVVQPVLRLAGFQRVRLKAGETRAVRFSIGREQLAILDRQMRWTVEPGRVELRIGRSSADTQPVMLEVAP